jgi:hypothetical protein
MNANLYDVAHVGVHSTETFSLISNTQAGALTKSGLIVASDGCGVAGFAQPFAPAQTQVSSNTLPSDNILLSYLYGSSKALAAMGAPFWRGTYGHFPAIYNQLKVNGAPTASYLGAAHFARMKRLYALAGTSKDELKANQNEMLFGDPFVDLRP